MFHRLSNCLMRKRPGEDVRLPYLRTEVHEKDQPSFLSFPNLTESKALCNPSLSSPDRFVMPSPSQQFSLLLPLCKASLRFHLSQANNHIAHLNRYVYSPLFSSKPLLSNLFQQGPLHPPPLHYQTISNGFQTPSLNLPPRQPSFRALLHHHLPRQLPPSPLIHPHLPPTIHRPHIHVPHHPAPLWPAGHLHLGTLCVGLTAAVGPGAALHRLDPSRRQRRLSGAGERRFPGGSWRAAGLECGKAPAVVEMEQSGVDVSCGAGRGAVGTRVDVGVEEKEGDVAEETGNQHRREDGLDSQPGRSIALDERPRLERKDVQAPGAAAAVVAASCGERGVFPPDTALERGRGLAGGALGGGFGHAGGRGGAQAGMEGDGLISWWLWFGSRGLVGKGRIHAFLFRHLMLEPRETPIPPSPTLPSLHFFSSHPPLTLPLTSTSTATPYIYPITMPFSRRGSRVQGG